jgi:cation:H+ antiporter
MTHLLALSALVAGLALLILGADRLIVGAVALARRLRLSDAVIGATIVAGGTSMPEMVASLASALQGQYGLAVGNVVGSNSANVGLILGAVGVMAPMAVPADIRRRDWPIMALVSLVFVGFILLTATTGGDGVRSAMLPRWFCLLFLVGFVAVIAWSVKTGRTSGDMDEPARHGPGMAVTWVLAGIAGLALGGHLLVWGAVRFATAMGVSQTLIGLTIVAIGTSTPELVTSLLAARRRQHGIAVANIVGSNTFNLLLILGVTGCFGPLPVDPSLLRVDLWVMLAFALVLPLVWTRAGIIGRGGSSLLLTGYLAYLAWLVADAL